MRVTHVCRYWHNVIHSSYSWDSGPCKAWEFFKYARRLTVCDAHHGQSQLVLQGFMLLVVDRKQIFITAVCFYRQKRIPCSKFCRVFTAGSKLEIFLEWYCVAGRKPIRREKTKPQAATVISLRFWLVRVPRSLLWLVTTRPRQNVYACAGLSISGHFSVTLSCQSLPRLLRECSLRFVGLLHVVILLFWNCFYGWPGTGLWKK